jgi:hypothetical protein
MLHPIEAQIARERHNERLNEAKQRRMNHSRQPGQPNLLNQLKSQLADWAELARPRRNRARRA